MSTSTGPGRPDFAIRKASRIAGAMLRASVTRALCLVIGSVMPVTSVSWNASVPSSFEGNCPVMKNVGMEYIIAVAIRVVRLVALWLAWGTADQNMAMRTEI